MIKLYRDSAEQLAMCLHYLMYRVGAGMSDVQQGVARHNNLRGEEIGAMRKSLRASASSLTPLKEQFDLHIKQINDEDNPNHDSDLIDLMVQTLQLPHVQNVLGGGRLNQLKKAILLPSEFGALAEKVRERELSCGHCGTQFKEGEAVTLRHTGDRTAPGMIYCAGCVRPDVITCPGCKKLCSVQKMNTSSEFVCPDCAGTAPKKKADAKKALKTLMDFSGRLGGVGTNTVQTGAQGVDPAPLNPTPIPVAPPGDGNPLFTTTWAGTGINLTPPFTPRRGDTPEPIRGTGITYAQMTAAANRAYDQAAEQVAFEAARAEPMPMPEPPPPTDINNLFDDLLEED